MKITIPTLFLIISFGFSIHAQQDAQFSQNNFNKLSFNPAYAGMRHSFCITALHRNQWNGFPGAPKNFLVSSDLFLRSFGGIGITILNDQLGLDRTNIFKFAGSFHVRPLGEGTLAIGIEAGAIQKTFGNGWIYNDAGDPLIPLNSISTTILDFGLGVYYEIEKTLFIGISTSQFPRVNLNQKQVL